MSFREYKTRAEMVAAGWKFPSEPKIVHCRNCNASIEWARSPKGKSIPVNVGSCIIHFQTCSGSDNGPSEPSERPRVRTQEGESARAPANVARQTDAPAKRLAYVANGAEGDLAAAVADLTVAIRALVTALREDK